VSIRILLNEAFGIWAADRGMAPPRDDPQSHRLVFTRGPELNRYWTYPSKAADVPRFNRALLDAVGRNEPYWVYPAKGAWSLGREADAWPQTRVWSAATHALGVPAGLRGAVRFNSTDWNELLAMLFLQVTLGPSARIDASVIPENGSSILFFEHREVVSAEFRDQAKLDVVAAALKEAGFPLPTKPPDATFKRPAWMSSRHGKPGEGS
jgi:hypothetical protein